MQNRLKPLASTVNEHLTPLVKEVAYQLKALTCADVPNYVMTASASFLFGALACIEDSYTRSFLFACSLGGGVLAINQYSFAQGGLQQTYAKALNAATSFFKPSSAPAPAPVTQPEATGLRTRKVSK